MCPRSLCFNCYLKREFQNKIKVERNKKQIEKSKRIDIRFFEIVLCQNRFIIIANFAPSYVERVFYKYRAERGTPVLDSGKYIDAHIYIN